MKEFALGPVNALVRAIWGKPAVPKKLLHGESIALHLEISLTHVDPEFNGYARPGEMVLVLGRPGSGCTTFLKTIANQRAGFLGVDGEVRYGGIGATEMGDRYKGEVVYNQEDDGESCVLLARSWADNLGHPVHQATLTVGQTILFALSTKVGLPCDVPEPVLTQSRTRHLAISSPTSHTPSSGTKSLNCCSRCSESRIPGTPKSAQRTYEVYQEVRGSECQLQRW